MLMWVKCTPDRCRVCDRPELGQDCEGIRQERRHPEDDRLRRLEDRVELLARIVEEQARDFLCNFVADCECDLEDAKACLDKYSKDDCPFRSECRWAVNLSAQLEQITK